VQTRARGQNAGGGTLAPTERWRQQWVMLCVCRTARRELWRMPEVQKRHALRGHQVQRVCGALRGAAKSSVCTRGTDGEGMRCCALCPPHSMAQAAACRFVKESGAGGSLELDAMAQHALRTPSPLLPHLRGAVRGGAWPWPWAAHPRRSTLSSAGRRLRLITLYNLTCTQLRISRHPDGAMPHSLHLTGLSPVDDNLRRSTLPFA